MAEQKKNICLYILKVLKQFSDDKHLMSQTDIQNRLSELGITCDRKTIARNIDYLTEFGYTIVKKIGGGCYFINETFDTSELTFLVDCIFSSPVISQKQAQSIIERLTSDASCSDKKRFKNIFKSEDIIRTDNKQVFYNIDCINNAIENDKQISFIYNVYDINKHLVPRKKEPYVINPYFMINSKGKYFLVCNKDNYNNLSNYRIDYITDIKIIDNKRKDIRLTKDYNGRVNPIEYANEHIYMFSGNTELIKLKLYNERMINEVIDWFGKDVQFFKEKEFIFSNIKANADAVIYWALQYGESVEIIEPISVRNKIKDIINKMQIKYK